MLFQRRMPFVSHPRVEEKGATPTLHTFGEPPKGKNLEEDNAIPMQQYVCEIGASSGSVGSGEDSEARFARV